MFKNRILMEAIANKQLLEHGKAYGFTKMDMEAIESNYRMWLSLLAAQGGSLDDIRDIPVIQN